MGLALQVSQQSLDLRLVSQLAACNLSCIFAWPPSSNSQQQRPCPNALCALSLNLAYKQGTGKPAAQQRAALLDTLLIRRPNPLAF